MQALAKETQALQACIVMGKVGQPTSDHAQAGVQMKKHVRDTILLGLHLQSLDRCVCHRVGDLIRFGLSTRLYLFNGPEELRPAEGLSKLQKKQLAALEVLHPHCPCPRQTKLVTGSL